MRKPLSPEITVMRVTRVRLRIFLKRVVMRLYAHRFISMGRVQSIFLRYDLGAL